MTNLKQSLISICVLTAAGFSATTFADEMQVSVVNEQHIANHNQMSFSSNQTASEHNRLSQSSQGETTASTQIAGTTNTTYYYSGDKNSLQQTQHSDNQSTNINSDIALTNTDSVVSKPSHTLALGEQQLNSTAATLNNAAASSASITSHSASHISNNVQSTLVGDVQQAALSSVQSSVSQSLSSNINSTINEQITTATHAEVANSVKNSLNLGL